MRRSRSSASTYYAQHSGIVISVGADEFCVVGNVFSFNQYYGSYSLAGSGVTRVVSLNAGSPNYP